MKIKYEFEGLCANCNHAIDCGNRKTARSVITQCELYECSNCKEEKDYKNISNDYISKESFEPKLKGLCCNCENRHSCSIDKPMGGVWHCEQYL